MYRIQVLKLTLPVCRNYFRVAHQILEGSFFYQRVTSFLKSTQSIWKIVREEECLSQLIQNVKKYSIKPYVT